MVNRLKEFLDHREENRPPETDYFVVSAKHEEFYVSREMAERLLRDLEVAAPSRWLRFTDVHGSRVCVRSDLIEHVRECTMTQRTADRDFHRERRRESKAERRWDDDDWPF